MKTIVIKTKGGAISPNELAALRADLMTRGFDVIVVNMNPIASIQSDLLIEFLPNSRRRWWHVIFSY